MAVRKGRAHNDCTKSSNEVVPTVAKTLFMGAELLNASLLANFLTLSRERGVACWVLGAVLGLWL